MADKKQKPRFALLLNEWKPEQYDTESSNYRLSIVRIDPSDDKPRNCSRTGEWDAPGSAIFDDLEISCYFSWRNGEWDANGMFNVRYRGYMYVEMHDAKSMLKGLTKAQKICSGFPVQPTTFGQFAALVATGFGVKECVRERENRGSFYTDSEWQILPISAVQRLVDAEMDRIRSVVVPSASVAA